jgi:3-polyprenyl-4-hydroxybenzoate decarboxylase
MPNVKALWSYAETGFHPLSAAIVKERYEKEALSTAFRILGEGQLSLTKFLMLTDQNIDLKNVKTLFETVLERFRPESDLYIFSNTSNDTLDYTGPKVNHGSKAVLLGLGEKKRTLPEHFTGTLPSAIHTAHPFCKGCLVLQVSPGFQNVEQLASHPDFANWPLLVLVDDVKASVSSSLEFLWTLFTRFDPVSDIYTNDREPRRHRIAYKAPILIDSRMKPSYPKEALVSEETAIMVNRKWPTYGFIPKQPQESDLG